MSKRSLKNRFFSKQLKISKTLCLFKLAFKFICVTQKYSNKWTLICSQVLVVYILHFQGWKKILQVFQAISLLCYGSVMLVKIKSLIINRFDSLFSGFCLFLFWWLQEYSLDWTQPNNQNASYLLLDCLQISSSVGSFPNTAERYLMFQSQSYLMSSSFVH